VADLFHIPFHVFPVTKDTKAAVEAQELELMARHRIDLVVLARYMQIVTDHFCDSISVINIHHSFLPAFIGGKPYHRAHERGVKVQYSTVQYMHIYRYIYIILVERAAVRQLHTKSVTDTLVLVLFYSILYS
jgi:formyltetrahydrofolate deformylase